MSTYDPKDDPGIPGSPPPSPGDPPPSANVPPPGEGHQGGGPAGPGPETPGVEPPPPGGPDAPKYEFGGVCMAPAVAPTQEEKNWALVTHLTPIVAGFFCLPFLGPLIVWLIKKDQSPYIAQNALQALAFSIAVFAVYIVTFLLMCAAGLGVLLTPLFLVALGYMIVGAINASNGYIYGYPLTSGFVSK